MSQRALGRQWFHMTDQENWQPDPEHKPADTYAEQAGQPRRAGLYVTDSPEHWAERGKRAIPLQVPDHVIARAEHDEYLREAFIPGPDVKHVSVRGRS